VHAQKPERPTFYTPQANSKGSVKADVLVKKMAKVLPLKTNL
jgi:hypothetical protein